MMSFCDRDASARRVTSIDGIDIESRAGSVEHMEDEVLRHK
jgi:hypothetical protein